MKQEISEAIEKVNAQREKFLGAFEEFGEALMRLVDAVEDLKRWE